MTADSNTVYCKCEGHRVPYAECAEPLCGKLRAEFKEATDTSAGRIQLNRIEAVGRAIFGAVTSANPEAFHPAYEHDRAVWDDAAKSAMAAFRQSPGDLMAEYERLRDDLETVGDPWRNDGSERHALDAFVSRLIALAEAGRVA